MESVFAKQQEQSVHTACRVRNIFCLWWLGMINNFHYTLVLSGSTAIAESYGMKKYVALITWANVFFGIVSRIVNAFLLPLLSYNIRITATSVMGILAILLVSFAWDIGGHKNVAAFIVTLTGVVFIGVASNYGEAVFLGYMERMPSKQIGSWSSGTGLSGVAASLIFLGLASAGLSNPQIFLISIPVLVMYWLLYFFGLKVPFYVPVRSGSTTSIDGVDAQPVDDGDGGYTYKAMTNWKGMPWADIIPAKREEKPECLKEMEREKLRAAMGDDYVEPMDTDNTPDSAQIGRWARCKRDTWPMIKEMHRFTLWNNFNLAAVYVAEYAVQFMAPFSFPCDTVKTSESFWLKNSFVITQFCYQFGVLISRSSLLCIRIRYVWIMTIIQVLNAIAWFVHAKTKYMSDPNNADRELKFAFGLFGWMIFVGLMGGASYVNVFYNILEETKRMQLDEEREILEGVVAAGEDSEELLAARHYIAMIWKEKRTLAMNIGALYATIGITLGSLLDLLFTLVLLKGDECT
ncbi:Batten's disease protein Cln3 [Trypanosoma melophagium]|uniref:Batten's disease protein Cln3 n=1 Tax=Trypanosoma melophagium TaxID=715481 RepID=UPI00351A214D|nr:Batten's disease protein Cln3 [Trypanosoma melophagium]